MSPEDLSEEDLTNLSFLNHDEIDYGALSDGTLGRLALGNELYIATSALAELSNRSSGLVAEISEKILSASHGDQYLQSAALSFLFELDRQRACVHILAMVCRSEPVMLTKIMKLIVEGHPYLNPESVTRLLKAIAERLSDLDLEDESVDPSVRDEFMKLYASTPG